MTVEKPYFLTNKEWYIEPPLDKNGESIIGAKYKLTDKAPQKAIDSYNEYYKETIY